MLRRACAAATLLILQQTRAQDSFSPQLSAERSRREQRGIRLAVIYDAEGTADLSGGARRGATYVGNLNFQLTLNLNALVGWPSATVHIDGLNIHGGQPSALAGDSQGISSIAGPNKWTLEEAWLQQNLFDDRVSILIGRYDLNSEFDRVHAADLFLHSAFGSDTNLAQSGRAGPSIFPNTALGGRLEAKPLDRLVLRVALLDGVPVDRPGGWNAFANGDGLLVIGEAAFLYRPANAASTEPRTRRLLVGRNAALPPYQAKIALGVWHYTASFADLSDVRANGHAANHDGSSGAYLIAETLVQQNGAGGELRVFGKAEIADPRVNRTSTFLAGGMTAKGYVAARPNDELCLGFVAAINGSHYLTAARRAGRAPSNAEVTIELPYLASITPWLSIEPDLQYVINPNTDSRLRNAFVALLRVEVSF